MSQKPVRTRDARTIEIEIDHREVTCPEGVTVLRAAELNGIFIPSLCAHKDLTPFGGCRLCLVEIEGMRGYPLACSTVAQEGMQVLTETAMLREMRADILELILSEHPSSCLICTEQDDCRENQYTIRKSGVSTGCRSCPRDGECELASLVEKLGVRDIRYPVDYRGYEPEHDDPFFDRDYNLCILCGRCVRMCQEVRGTSVLAFEYRGPRTRIGPAFGRSHVEAGCEFCGACVSVCPTGALVDKVSKWDGRSDGFEVSTCPFCGLGCRIELQHRAGRLSKVRPHLDAEINDGQLCVRGRFCLPEATHHHERGRKPALRRGVYFREVDWSEALDDAAGRLQGLRAEDFLMVVSPDLTNESLYAAQRFVRSVMGSNSIDSTGRWALPGGIGLWSQLFSLPISIASLARADAVIAVGLDSRFTWSVIGVEIRRALRDGAVLVTVDSRDSNLARYTDHWLRPHPGMEGLILRMLADGLPGGGGGLGDGAGGGGDDREAGGENRGGAGRTRGNKRDLAGRAGDFGAGQATGDAGVAAAALKRALNALKPCRSLAVVVGPSAFASDLDNELARTLLRLGRREDTTVLPLYYGANTRGAIELGAFGEVLPGFEKAEGDGITLEDLVSGRAKPKVLYLVGETPFSERPRCEYVIAQDLYHPPFEIDAFFPAASFAEAEGTLTNFEGRVQELVKVEDRPDGAMTGYCRPDWRIFDMLATRLGRSDLHFDSAGDILRGIHDAVPEFPDRPDRRPRRLQPKITIPWQTRSSARSANHGWRLILEPGAFRHRGIDLSHVVEGLGELGLEEGCRLHPDDMKKLKLERGAQVTLRLDGMTIVEAARPDPDCPRGAVVIHRPHAFGGIPRRRELEPLYRLEGSLFGVAVAVPGSPRPAGRRRTGESRGSKEGS